jgi:hypothetical protein
MAEALGAWRAATWSSSLSLPLRGSAVRDPTAGNQRFPMLLDILIESLACCSKTLMEGGIGPLSRLKIENGSTISGDS